MRAAGLRFDALVTPRTCRTWRGCWRGGPDLKVVIDHGAKPDIAAGAIADWAAAIRAIARDTGAVCKLSGLVTEAGAGWSDRAAEAVRRRAARRVRAGAADVGQRLAGGEPGRRLRGWRAAAEALTAGLAADDRWRRSSAGPPPPSTGSPAEADRGADVLPDGCAGVLVGRLWMDDGPTRWSRRATATSSTFRRSRRR